MFLICGWCRKDLGEKAPLKNKDVTHGICKPCADGLWTKYMMSDVLKPDDILKKHAGYMMPNWRRKMHEGAAKKEMEINLDKTKSGL